jgi:hypothetical protein
MTLLNQITALKIATVGERGKPNQEYVAIHVLEDVNMATFHLILGVESTPGQASPINDCMFRFGEGFVRAGDWIFVFTGGGTTGKERSTDDTFDIYTLYWGRSTTLFADSQVVPMIIEISAVEVAHSPRNQAQRAIGQQ